ncbi:hypothetical protein FJZ20_01185 [Candidatus Pacearchaeota archaeon]|nr:hypothetical protein [Candidatus Pacearchaeota archaeon]
MRFNLKDVKFSKYDFIRKISLPKDLSPELSELIGIIMGDGNIYMKNKRYELSITGDANEDVEYHGNHINPIFKKVFNINPVTKIRIFKDSRRCVITKFESKGVISFLTDCIGLPKGKKSDIKVPKCIFSANKKEIYRFLRGLADTDFSIKFKTRYKKKNYYPIMIGYFSSNSFVKQLKGLLNKIGFSSHIEKREKIDNKKGKKYYGSSINIVGKKNFDKWMNKVGFANKRHITRYKVWKKLGYCPPYTNIERGELILIR